jgi:hypothetical protein
MSAIPDRGERMIEPSRARVVDQDVNPAQGGEAGIDDSLNFFCLRDVGWNSRDRDAVSAQELRRILQLFLASSTYRNMRAFLRQLFCNSFPQPFARPCDQDALALESQVHKHPSLSSASTGTEEWTAHYDRPFKDIFAVQDEIVSKVVTTVGLIFKLDEMKPPNSGGARPTDNLDAFDDLLRASDYAWRETWNDNVKAQQWPEKAISLDPPDTVRHSPS